MERNRNQRGFRQRFLQILALLGNGMLGLLHRIALIFCRAFGFRMWFAKLWVGMFITYLTIESFLVPHLIADTAISGATLPLEVISDITLKAFKKIGTTYNLKNAMQCGFMEFQMFQNYLDIEIDWMDYLYLLNKAIYTESRLLLTSTNQKLSKSSSRSSTRKRKSRSDSESPLSLYEMEGSELVRMERVHSYQTSSPSYSYSSDIITQPGQTYKEFSSRVISLIPYVHLAEMPETTEDHLCNSAYKVLKLMEGSRFYNTISLLEKICSERAMSTVQANSCRSLAMEAQLLVETSTQMAFDDLRVLYKDMVKRGKNQLTLYQLECIHACIAFFFLTIFMAILGRLFPIGIIERR